MKKLTVYTSDIHRNDIKAYREKKSRVTVQLRIYDENGNYEKGSERSNFTIHIKGCSGIDDAILRVQQAILSSKLFSNVYDVDDEPAGE